MEGNFFSAFRWQLVHHRIPGRYKSMLFATLSKTWNSLPGIGVGFIALEWPGKEQEQYCLWPSIWQTKFPRSIYLFIIYLFQDLYTRYIYLQGSTTLYRDRREIIWLRKHTCPVFFPSNNTFSQEATFHQKMRKLIVTLLRWTRTSCLTSNRKFNIVTTTNFLLQKIWERKTFTEAALSV